MCINISWKQFSFRLKKRLKTSQGILHEKRGFLLKLKDSFGHLGWGEISPLNPSELEVCGNLLKEIGRNPLRKDLESSLSKFPGAMAFGVGAALAELAFAGSALAGPAGAGPAEHRRACESVASFDLPSSS